MLNEKYDGFVEKGLGQTENDLRITSRRCDLCGQRLSTSEFTSKDLSFGKVIWRFEVAGECE
jgi:hypothetical protein